VVLMAERNRLLRRNVLVGDPGRALQLQQRAARAGKQKNDAENAGPSQRVCAAVKDLCH